MYSDRARRKSREIALAIVLTLAAIAFVVAAMQRNTRETAAVTIPVMPSQSAN